MRTLPVTNHLLHAAYRDRQDDDLTPLRVQKLLYFLHGWYSAVTGTPLLDEPFVRGKFGPKLLSLDADLAHYQGVPVAEYVSEWNADTGQLTPMFVNLEAFPQFGPVLEKVWREYARYTTAELSSMSHGAGSPWDRTTGEGLPISQATIADAFLRLAGENRARALKVTDPA